MDKVNKNIYISFVFLVLLFNLPQIASATIYQPGATLEPDCAPGSANCGVATSIVSLGTSVSIGNSSLTIVATSTDSILATLRASVGQVTNLFQIQDSGGSNLFSIGPSGNLTLESLNGPLQANAGLVSATTSIGVLYGGTGTTNGSITGTGALSFTSNTTNALTLDSGTTGAVNIGTGANAKTITIGNATGVSTTNLLAGTGNVTVGTSDTTGTLLVLDTKTGAGDPTGVNGGMYYNSNTGKFRCYQSGAWANCITASGSNLQHVASYDTDEALTNVPTGGAQITLGTVSITPTSATGDIYVTGWADVLSSNGTDQPLQIVIETTNNCTGSTVGNASVTYTITSTASANTRGTIRVSGIAVNAGASAHPYSLCAAVTSGGGDSDIKNWGIEALVIDTGADLAEIYTTNDESIEIGDVVSLDSNLQTGTKKSQIAYDQNVLGIVSARPGLVIGDVDKEGVKAVPVALSGRVPVKVSTENGDIEPGDYLGPSSEPGVAMKSNGIGPVIGLAMSAYSNEGVGMIKIFIKNFDFGEGTVLLGDISKTDGLVTLITDIQIETAHDPIAVITQKITDSKQFLTDFVAARITAIRGYFDELFARIIHTEQLCFKKSDGNEICLNGDQINSVFKNGNVTISSVVNSEPALPPEAVAGTSTESIQSVPVEVSADVSSTTPDISANETEVADPTLVEPITQ